MAQAPNDTKVSHDTNLPKEKGETSSLQKHPYFKAKMKILDAERKEILYVPNGGKPLPKGVNGEVIFIPVSVGSDSYKGPQFHALVRELKERYAQYRNTRVIVGVGDIVQAETLLFKRKDRFIYKESDFEESEAARKALETKVQGYLVEALELAKVEGAKWRNDPEIVAALEDLTEFFGKDESGKDNVIIQSWTELEYAITENASKSKIDYATCEAVHNNLTREKEYNYFNIAAQDEYSVKFAKVQMSAGKSTTRVDTDNARYIPSAFVKEHSANYLRRDVSVLSGTVFRLQNQYNSDVVFAYPFPTPGPEGAPTMHMVGLHLQQLQKLHLSNTKVDAEKNNEQCLLPSAIMAAQKKLITPILDLKPIPAPVHVASAVPVNIPKKEKREHQNSASNKERQARRAARKAEAEKNDGAHGNTSQLDHDDAQVEGRYTRKTKAEHNSPQDPLSSASSSKPSSPESTSPLSTSPPVIVELSEIDKSRNMKAPAPAPAPANAKGGIPRAEGTTAHSDNTKQSKHSHALPPAPPAPTALHPTAPTSAPAAPAATASSSDGNTSPKAAAVNNDNRDRSPPMKLQQAPVHCAPQAVLYGSSRSTKSRVRTIAIPESTYQEYAAAGPVFKDLTKIGKDSFLGIFSKYYVASTVADMRDSVAMAADIDLSPTSSPRSISPSPSGSGSSDGE